MGMAIGDTYRQLMGTIARLSSMDQRATANRWIAVLFHNISDGDDRGRSQFVNGLGVTTELRAFIDCMHYLARTYDVVGLPELLSQVDGNATRRNTRGRRRLLICFDDAYASAAQLAAPVLAEMGMSWCFFLNPSLVGNKTLAADNAAAYVANAYGLDPLSRAAGRPISSVGDLIRNDFSVCTPAQRCVLISRLLDDVGADPHALASEAGLYVEADDIRQLADSGVEIGNHTADHVHCRTLDPESVSVQVVDSASAVASLSGRPVRAFAYPYGSELDRTALVTAALRASGHQCAFLVHNRFNTIQTDRWGYYRITLRSGDRRIIAAELEVLPRIRAAKAAVLPAVRRITHRVA